MPPGARLEDVQNRVIATLDPGDVDTIEQVNDAIIQLGEAAPGATARAALARFRERDHEAAVEPGVHLLNAHTGNGQQFDWIIACGIEEGPPQAMSGFPLVRQPTGAASRSGLDA